MKHKPGVMLYFDILPVVRRWKPEEQANLLLAVLEYGQTGQEIPMLDQVDMFWPMIRSRLEQDEDRYQYTVTRRAYAAYVRWAKARGKEPLTLALWQEQKRLGLVEEDPTLSYELT